tara:strand:+ start:170 stop:430 length:261 start_codon:yes stop_codon:yes gene_type:complete
MLNIKFGNKYNWNLKRKQLNKSIKINDIIEFKNYCYEFYNINYGIYPIATNIEIDNAIMKYFYISNYKDIDFDSLDRENVRIILNK